MSLEEMHKQIPSFLNKLYEILSYDKNQSIQWNEDGKSFKILDPNQLVTTILPHYFKHQNYQSFLRQLNMYGFKKVKQEKNSFCHPLFSKGDIDHLTQIKRRNQDDIRKTLESLTKGFQQESLAQEHENLRRQLLHLKETQLRLHDEFIYQIERNKNLKLETQDLLQRMSIAKVQQVQKLNKLALIISRLPQDASRGKLALKREKIISKIQEINQNYYEGGQETYSTYSSHPTLLTARSPLTLGFMAH